MNMKAVILAAGMGNRMQSLTANNPKTLIKVKGKTLLERILKALAEAGIREVVIVTGFKADKVRELAGPGERFGLVIKYVHNSDYSRTNNIFSLFLARSRLQGSAFLIVNSDLLFHPDILEKLLSDSREGVILAVDTLKSLGEEEMKVEIEDGKISNISKEIPLERAKGEYIGLARIDSSSSEEFFKALEEALEELGHGVFYEEAFRRYIERGGEVLYVSTEGKPWIEIDTPEDLRKAEEEIEPEISQ